MTRVVCRQLAPRVGEVAHNHAMILDAISGHTDADLLVLPELASSGYVFTNPEEARECALTVDDQRVEDWVAATPPGLIVATGFAELGSDGNVYNSALLLDATGVLATYRKVHLWDREKLAFTAGASPAPVVETRHGRLGMMVCYDLEFPEYTRACALAGADALVVPTNWPLVDRPDGERPPEVVIGQAAARVNRMAIICCDRSGTERGQDWTEGTTVIGHDGWVVATADADGVLACDLDLTAGRDKAIGPRNHLFTDRRADLY